MCTTVDLQSSLAADFPVCHPISPVVPRLLVALSALQFSNRLKVQQRGDKYYKGYRPDHFFSEARLNGQCSDEEKKLGRIVAAAQKYCWPPGYTTPREGGSRIRASQHGELRKSSYLL